MKNKYLILVILFILLSQGLSAQLTVDNGGTLTLTPLQLVQQYLVGQGVTISNATYNGSSAVIPNTNVGNQIGTFEAIGNAITQLGLVDGIIMTSGKASIAIGPNNQTGAGSGNSGASDPDLNVLSGTTTHDKCVLEFDFVPQFDTIKFRYVFGSEEFYEYCNQFNDAFGFFLSGPGINGTYSNNSVNIAKMPGSNNPVTINNICADPTSNWNNLGGLYYQYDGLTHVFTAWYVVQPCSTYHIKLAVADALDYAYDSGVFLEKGSFSSSSLTVTNTFSVPKLGYKTVEGCSSATITFTLGQTQALPYIVNYTIGGTAINCVDYPCIPTSVTIPAGQLTTNIVIAPIIDGLTEGVETAILGVITPTCTGSTIFYDTIYIIDNSPLVAIAGNDTTVCNGDSVHLHATSTGGQYPFVYFWPTTGWPLRLQTLLPPPGVTAYPVWVTDACSTTAYDTTIVTVTPLPLITNTSLLSDVCSGSATNIVLQSNVTGVIFVWTATCSSPNITGYSGGSGTSIIQTLNNSGLGFDTVKYNVHAIGNGCSGLPVTFKVTVKPKPDAYFTPNGQNICSSTLTNILIQSHVPGATFSWTYSSPPTVVGASNGTGNTIAQGLVNIGSSIDTVTYHVTPVANSCTGNIYNVKVIVNPVAQITITPLAATICSNTSTNIPLNSNVVGSTFTWTCSLMSGNITGFSNGSGNLIAQVLVNNINSPGLVKYRIIPLANGCVGQYSDYLVTVDPSPSITNTTLNSQFCSGGTTNITIQSNTSGTTFSWTASASSVNISGYSNGSGGTISQTLTNSGYNIDSVTYHVTPFYDGCSGLPVNFVVKVFPIPNAYSIPAGQSICSGSTTVIALHSNVAAVTYTWTANGSSPNLTGFSAGSGDSIKQLLTNSGFTTETVTYHVIPAANGCSPLTPHDIIITVYPVPDLSNIPLNKSICNTTSTGITLSSHVTGTLFTWTTTGSTPQVTGFTNNNTPSITINDLLTNSGYSIETVTYHITSIANGCTGPITDYVVNVYPTPDLTNIPLSKSMCQSNSTNILLTSNVTGTLFTWTCTPGSPNVIGWSNNTSSPTTLIDQFLTITSVISEIVTYHITPQISNCAGIVYDYVVTVNPRPLLTTNPMHDTVCSGTTTDIHLTSSCAGTTFSWTAQLISGTITGFSNGAGPLISQILVNTGYTTGSVEYNITPTAGLCVGDDTIYMVYSYPKPDLTTTPLNTSVCSNTTTNIPLTSHVAGTNFFWTAQASSPNITGFSAGNGTNISQTLVNSGFTTETVTYRIVPRANGCNGDTINYTVIVYPVPDAHSQPSSQSLCSGSTTLLVLSSNVTNASFTWTASGSSPNVTGYSGGANDTIAQTLVNNGTTTETVTYTVLPVANGCPAGPSLIIIVTVYPAPHATASPSLQTICTGVGFTSNLTSTIAGSTFAWTCTASSPNLSGFAAGSGNQISQTVSNSGFTIETVTYHITPTANNCQGPVTNFLLTVNPKPDLSNTPASSQVCNNTAIGITLTSHVTGTLFTWTATGSSPQVTGYTNNNIPSITINDILINSGLNVETVTYHITPHANGCNGNLTDFVVTVVSSPDIYFNPPAQTICSGQVSSIQLLSHVPGTTYNWTTSASSPNLTGFSNGNGNVIAQTVTNSGTTIETVTYTVFPTAWNCPAGTPQNVVLTVNPKPVITNATTTFSQCSAVTTNIAPQSTVSGSTYTWTATGSSPQVTGYTTTNIPSMTINDHLVNTGYNIETVTYQVIATANNCNSAPVPFVVTVFPVPDVYFTPPSQTICPLQSCSIALNSHVTGTSYSWTASGSSANITGFLSGSGLVIQQILDNLSYNIEQATYHVLPVANGCQGVTTNVVVTVDPAPVVTFTACTDMITTTDAQPILLKGGIPLGGTYSGRGVSNGKLYPAIAGTGADTITYAYTNMFSCIRSNQQIINIISPIPSTCGNLFTDPRDTKSYPTVQIGTQCWMAANLDFGILIPSSAMQRENCQEEKYCFNDLPANCFSSGGLYQWDELMRYNSASGAQGLCPPAWHIPAENEWNTLFSFYTSNGFAGSPLKFTGYSGFNALLDGVRFKNSSWNFNSFATLLWSSSSHGPYKAWAHGMNTYNPSVSFYPASRSNAFSVRCIKD